MKKATSKKLTSKTTDSRRFDAIDAKLDRIIDSMVTQQEFRRYTEEANARFERIEHSIERLVTAVDKLRKSVDDLMLEYAVITKQMERYDRWFKEIAKKIGVELKP